MKQAVLDVTREFEEHQAALKAENADRQAAEADAELRRRVREDVTRTLRHRLGDDNWSDMHEAIDARFTKLPRGTRRTGLEAGMSSSRGSVAGAAGGVGPTTTPAGSA